MKEPTEPSTIQEELLSIISIAEGRISPSGLRDRLIKFPGISLSDLMPMLWEMAEAGQIVRHQTEGGRALYSRASPMHEAPAEPELVPSPFHPQSRMTVGDLARVQTALPSATPEVAPVAEKVIVPPVSTPDLIMKLIRERPHTNKELSVALEFSSAGISFQTNKLKAQGLIQKQGPKGAWTVTGPASADTTSQLLVARRKSKPILEKPASRTSPPDDLDAALTALDARLSPIQALQVKVLTLDRLSILLEPSISAVLIAVREDLVRLSAKG